MRHCLHTTIGATLAIALVASCQTAKKPDASLAKDGPASPPQEVLDAFQASCLGCHAKYKDLATGKISWPKLVANATKIAQRIDPANTSENRMPPEDAEPDQMVDEEMRAKMYAAIKAAAPSGPGGQNPTNLPLAQIKLPPGFKIAVYAVVKGARSMTLSPSGTVYVGTGGFAHPDKKVYAVRDNDGDKYAEQVLKILDLPQVQGQESPNPNGVAFKDGDLYVADRYRILKLKGIEASLQNPPAPVVVFDKFPKAKSHSWKFLAVGPDGKLYVPVGAPCNICEPDADPATKGKFMRIFRLNTDGTGFEAVASGVRNTVGYDWHPVTKEMWFTDNGRDQLGDSVPPDELNRLTQTGQFFGYPYCHGNGIADPDLNETGSELDCQGNGYVRPMRALGAHVAALGMRFYTGSMFPAEYKNQIFIAEHGSWNSSVPVGYRVTLVRPGANGQLGYETFASGWVTPGGEDWGRPVDVLNLPDGSLLVSDDKAGVIYRITYAP